MTYAEFHLAYTIPPLVALALVQARPLAGVSARPALGWLGALTAIAFVYTTPWDNYLVYRDVWGYPADAVIGTLGYVPYEEYFFFLIQPFIVGFFYFFLRGRGLLRSPVEPMPRWVRPAGLVLWASLTLLGIAMLIHLSDHAIYMGLILAWAAPVLGGMWYVGAANVWAERRRWLVGLAVPTVYFWIVDRIAILRGIWDIRDRYSLGVDPLGLPVEEATFFLLTTTLCVTGLVLFLPAPAQPLRP